MPPIHEPSTGMAVADNPAGSTMGDPDTSEVGIASHGPANALNHPSGGGMMGSTAPKKKHRGRPRKKKTAPVADHDDVARVTVEHIHQKIRMQGYKKMKAGEKDRRSRMESSRFKKILNAATSIPCELGHLRPSLKVAHQPRVYRHEELRALGVRIVPWDGQ